MIKYNSKNYNNTQKKYLTFNNTRMLNKMKMKIIKKKILYKKIKKKKMTKIIIT